MARQCAPWYPTIFPDRCDGCKGREAPRCIQFCPNDVFEIRSEKAVVVRPYNCVYGCTACEPVCPRKAITFPQKGYAQTSLPKDKGLLHRVKCEGCGKIFWTNRDTILCFDCETRSKV